MELCPYCDGEGENLDMARCTDCNGTGLLGEVEHEDGPMIDWCEHGKMLVCEECAKRHQSTE